ncbi:MAG TPA: alpha/beta hydrolase [Gaiellaceae bacterium]|jgi:pimeloyl-ACP methyl ester carboxylesterase|nr:alpha/beta hydrolase [Gaiellaceae bacterium]
MKTRLVDAGDAKLQLREWGDESGRPLLFWHALGDHTSLQLVEVAPLLVRDYGLRVLALDAPGFGGSPRLPDKRYQLPALVDLARSFLDALGLDRVDWLGSSWGGTVGVHAAAAHPDRIEALVLLDGGYLGPAEDFGASLKMIRRHWRSQPALWSYDSWERIDEDARAYFMRWTPALAASCRSAYREQDGKVVSIMGPDVYAAAIWGVLRAPPAEALARLGASGVPTLLLAATLPPEEKERRRPAREQFAALVPQAEVRLMDTQHFVLEDAPEETAREIGEWLRRRS